MDNTMLIQVTNQKAIGLLHELEELRLIKVLKENFAPVKIKTISAEKSLLMAEIKEAVEELKLVRQGKIKGIPAKQLLDEL
jgi:hypothetical protein